MPFGLGRPSAAGSGLEVINIEVASFRLGAPAAGSGTWSGEFN